MAEQNPNEVESILFTSTSPSQTGNQIPIILGYGMERTYQFLEGNQVRGEQVTAQYISDTFSYYEIGEEIRGTSETEEPDRWSILRTNEAQVLDQIRKYQQDSLVMEFSNAMRKIQQKEIKKEQVKTLNFKHLV